MRFGEESDAAGIALFFCPQRRAHHSPWKTKALNSSRPQAAQKGEAHY